MGNLFSKSPSRPRANVRNSRTSCPAAFTRSVANESTRSANFQSPETTRLARSPRLTAPDVNNNKHGWAITKADEDSFVFLWTLKNYSSLVAKKKEITSPVFTGGPKNLHSWQLELDPEKLVKGKKYLYIILKLVGFAESALNETTLKKEQPSLRARHQIKLLKSNGTAGSQKGGPKSSYFQFYEGKGRGWCVMPSSELVHRVYQSESLLVNDTLRIRCKVWIEGDLIHETVNGLEKVKVAQNEEIKHLHHEQLEKNWRGVLGDDSVPEVIISSGNTKFKVHKSVLVARSPVFRRMFSTNMSAIANNTIEITNFEPEIVQGMIEYMYTGETKSLKENATDLFQIAEKYDMPGLKTDCEYIIGNTLTAENCLDILLMAHLHNATYLRIKAIQFMSKSKNNDEMVRKYANDWVCSLNFKI